MWRSPTRSQSRLDQSVPSKVLPDTDAATRTKIPEGGILRGLCASFARQKLATPTHSSPAADVVRPRANMEVTPGNGPSRFQFLDVKNLGEDATFHAEGQIISSQNTNSVSTGLYPLGWGRDRDSWVSIPKGATRQILIATIREVSAGSLFHLALMQAGPSVERHWARWNAQESLPLPRFGLRLSIIAEGAQESWTGYFSVTPESLDGVGVRLSFRGLETATSSATNRLDEPITPTAG